MVSSSIFFHLFSSPDLSCRRLDVYTILPHMVHGLSVNLRCKSETCCTRLAKSTGCKYRQKFAIYRHRRTTLSGYIFATKALIDNRKKFVRQQYLPTCSRTSAPGWDRFGCLGHPSKFQRVSRLGFVTARHSSSGVSQTLRRWPEGATYIRQGGHHVGNWPTFLVIVIKCLTV